MEEDLARFTTPMYRSPEMVDVWSDFPVGPASDIWSLGCVLFQLCFHRHPFEDGAKLAIINANYSIPEDTDMTHQAFHDLVRQALAVDPRTRPSAQQMLEHLGQVAVLSDWDLEAKIDFERQTAAEEVPLEVAASSQQHPSVSEPPLSNSNQHRHPSPRTERPPSAQGQQQQQQPSSSGFLSSVRGAGSHMLGKVLCSLKCG